MKQRGFKSFSLSILSLMLLILFSDKAWAVVGQAEQYSEFKQEDLDTFQSNIQAEERQRQLSQMQMAQNFQNASGQSNEALDQQLQEMQRQLLSLPQRDRFRVEATGSYKYDSNIIRAVPRQEKDDSHFDTDGTLYFDLSGKKTDLRFEVASGRHWSWEFPEGDFWSAEERLRFRRNFMRKLQSSWQSKLLRHSSKTVEINAEKVRWDSNQVSTYNYQFSRKLSFNLDTSSTMRTFTQEAFDQDSSWEATFAPDAFWNLTPKSRVSFGYRFGANRIRTKSGNTNTHEIHAGYFGKVTRKSSASLDLSFSHQTPKSRDTATVNTYTVGVGYIWQITPKTQLTVQAIRSLQNSSSDLVSGELDGENVTVKSDSYFTNTNLSFALNSRLSSKLTLSPTFSISYANTKVLKDGDKDSETTQFTFPFAINGNYVLRRWAFLTFGYTFTYRTGYEKIDRFRDHLIQTSLRLVI